MSITKFGIADAAWMGCDCGGLMFTQLIMIKRISRLQTGEAQDKIMEIPMLQCTTCGKVPTFMHQPFSDFPENMKSTTLTNT